MGASACRGEVKFGTADLVLDTTGVEQKGDVGLGIPVPASARSGDED